jgi:hypothetical protein
VEFFSRLDRFWYSSKEMAPRKCAAYFCEPTWQSLDRTIVEALVSVPV